MRNVLRAFRAVFLACLPVALPLSANAAVLDDLEAKSAQFIEKHPCSQPGNTSDAGCASRISSITGAQAALRALVDGSVRGAAIRKQVNALRGALLELRSYRPPVTERASVVASVPEMPAASLSGFPYRITRYADFFEGRKTSLGDTFTQAGYSMAICGPELGYLGYVVPKQWSRILVKLNDRPSCTKNPDILDLPTRAYRDVFSGNPRDISGNFVPVMKFPKYVKSTVKIGEGTYPNAYFVGESVDFSPLPAEYAKIVWTFPDGRISETLNESAGEAWHHSWYFDAEGKYQAKALDRNGIVVAIFEFWAFPFAQFAPVQFGNAETTERAIGDSTFLIDKVRIDEHRLWYRFRSKPSDEFWFVTIGGGSDAPVFSGKDGIFVPLESLVFPADGVGIPFKAFRAVSPTGFSHDAQRIETTDYVGILQADSTGEVYIANK